VLRPCILLQLLLLLLLLLGLKRQLLWRHSLLLL
jgi:hypothetical protein